MRILLVILGLSCFGVSSQSNVDSLQRITENSVHDSIKVKAFDEWESLIYQSDPSLGIRLNQNIDSISDLHLNSDFATKDEIFFKKAKGKATNALGLAFIYRGEYARALDYLQVSKKLQIELGDSLKLSDVINNFGNVQVYQGNYSAGLKFYKESLAIREQINATKQIAYSKINIGNISYFLGDYKAALSNYKSSYELVLQIDDQFGESFCLGNIALIYMNQGNHTEAIEYFTKAKDLRLRMENKKEASAAMIGLGVCYMNLGDSAITHRLFATAHENYEIATSHYLEALPIKIEIEDQQGIAGIYSNLGLIQINEEKYDSAEANLIRALDINRKIGDKLGITNCLNNLGRIKLAHMDPGGAKELATEALQIAEELGGIYERRHAHLTLFRAYIDLDSVNQANLNINEVISSRRFELINNFPILTDLEKEYYLSTMLEDFNIYSEFGLKNQNEIPECGGRLYDNSLVTKGFLLKSSTALKAAVFDSDRPDIEEKYSKWLELKQQIVSKYSIGEKIDSLESEATNLEKELAAETLGKADGSHIQNLNWKDVQSYAESNDIMIEFIRFAKQGMNPHYSKRKYYYAGVLMGANSKCPIGVELFEESELEKIIGTFPGNNLSYIEEVYGTKSNTKTQLYDLIWKPLEPHLKGIEKVYVSPVGLLHKISFAALAKEQDVLLCDSYDIEIMSSTGNLAANKPTKVDRTSAYTIFGGIDYNSDSTSSEIWSYLDGSLSETEKIEKTLSKADRQVSYYNLSLATEEQFKKTASESTVLHIATHGFFYADPDEVLEASIDREESEGYLIFRGGTSGLGVNTFVKSRNPLMRSGLVFAGANDVWNRTSIEGEDGVLTAAEVATIDMRNTELVVLSACETGLGDIKGSEGVYGLQRSFKMAGVKYLIMSLWQVPDKETAEFMTTFYEKLTENNDIKKAFKETQLEMRKKYDPYYWGAFVLIE